MVGGPCSMRMAAGGVPVRECKYEENVMVLCESSVM